MKNTPKPPEANSPVSEIPAVEPRGLDADEPPLVPVTTEKRDMGEEEWGSRSFVCPACGWEGDPDDEQNSLRQQSERRSALEKSKDEMRTISPKLLRSLSQEVQDGLNLLQQCRAACYGLMSYLCYMPWEAVPAGTYTSLYECFSCCDLCIGLAGSESVLSSSAYELCSAACRKTATDCALDDAMLQALASLCVKAADVCDLLAAPGESEEDRAVRKMGDQVRSFTSEIRSTDDGRKVVGYPIRFNELSQDLGGFRERILPTAIQFSDDVRADFNHSPDYILGRRSAGTLTLSVDGIGVRMEADAPQTSWANDLLESIRRGDINQGSFAFRVLPGGQQISDENGQQIRTLSKILVRRVSVVSDPAYTGTSVQVRSNPAAKLPDPTAGLAAPSASRGGVGSEHLRRLQMQSESE